MSEFLTQNVKRLKRIQRRIIGALLLRNHKNNKIQCNEPENFSLEASAAIRENENEIDTHFGTFDN